MIYKTYPLRKVGFIRFRIEDEAYANRCRQSWPWLRKLNAGRRSSSNDWLHDSKVKGA